MARCNHEVRMTNSRINGELTKLQRCHFGILASGLLRHSTFVVRHLTTFAVSA